jgi:regulatory protein
LRNKGFSLQVVEGVVEELEERGLLEDACLARDMVMNGQRANKSRSRIYADLRKRGIDRDIAEESLQSCFDPEKEREAATCLLQKSLYTSSSPPTEADIERAARRLSGRGFSPSAVLNALAGIKRDAGA